MLPIFTILGHELYSYPLVMGMAWAIAFQLTEHVNKVAGIPIKSLKQYFLLVFLVSWVGAKLFFLLTVNLDTNHVRLEVASMSSFWLGGGFVFYGGMLFGLALTVLYFYKKQIPRENINIFIPGLALGHAIGRIGCFLAGCCYGKETEFFLSIYLHGHNRHPVQLYESLLLLILGIVFYFKLAKKFKNNIPSISIWPDYLIGYGVIRFMMEMLRGDKIRGIILGDLSTSQLISTLIILSAVVFKYFTKKSKII